jgi:hypothetical protein
MRISRRIAELLDRREFFTRERAAPRGLEGCLVLGPIGEQIEHAVANLRTLAEDALEFVRGGAVDGEPAVPGIGHLHEGIGSFDDIGQKVAFGDGFGDATSRPSLCRNARSARTFTVVSDTAQSDSAAAMPTTAAAATISLVRDAMTSSDRPA